MTKTQKQIRNKIVRKLGEMIEGNGVDIRICRQLWSTHHDESYLIYWAVEDWIKTCFRNYPKRKGLSTTAYP